MKYSCCQSLKFILCSLNIFLNTRLRDALFHEDGCALFISLSRNHSLISCRESKVLVHFQPSSKFTPLPHPPPTSAGRCVFQRFSQHPEFRGQLHLFVFGGYVRPPLPSLPSQCLLEASHQTKLWISSNGPPCSELSLCPQVVNLQTWPWTTCGVEKPQALLLWCLVTPELCKLEKHQ